jgi:3-oxoacyl-[acyl-carrier-protein] synthase II
VASSSAAVSTAAASQHPRREGIIPVTDNVVVTGLGAMTPLGGDVASTWKGLVDGQSGVGVIEDEWARDLPVRLAARVPVDPAETLTYKEARRLDRCEQLAVISAREAWADAGRPEADPSRIAVSIGTGIGGVHSILSQHRILMDQGARKVSPHTVTMLMANGPSAWVSLDVGARGGVRTPVSACASGSEGIALGIEMIERGQADVVVAGGSEATVDTLPLAAFAQMRALSTRHDDPEGASRPFDVNRDGFVMGEGAVVFILEREEFARARGAKIYARAAGAGLTSDAIDIVAADPAGQAAAMRIALARAGLAPSDIDVIHAHATATPVGDPSEATAIRAVIATPPAVTASKSMTGHMLGASGALGALLVILSMRDGVIPPTRNLDTLDPAIDLDVVRGGARAATPRAGLANAFGFGGHNVTLAFTAV